MLKVKIGLVSITIATMLALCSGVALAAIISPYSPFDPTIDGVFTDSNEWQNATIVPNDLGTGTFYIQNNNNETSFIMHEYWNAIDYEDWMYNTFESTLECTDGSWHTIKTWVFTDGDTSDANDSEWLPASGLGLGYSPPFNDTGFLVRVDDDPATDFHWLPGDPIDLNDTYGVFAWGGYGPSRTIDGSCIQWEYSITGGYELGSYWTKKFVLCTTEYTIKIKDPTPKEKASLEKMLEELMKLDAANVDLGLVTDKQLDVLPGETATHILFVRNNGIKKDTINLEKKVLSQTGDWTHTLDQTTVELEPWPKLGCVEFVILKVTADPNNEPSNIVVIDVTGTSRNSAMVGKIQTDTVTTITHTVPEFTTIAIPVAAIIGLLFLFSRRRKKEE